MTVTTRAGRDASSRDDSGETVTKKDLSPSSTTICDGVSLMTLPRSDRCTARTRRLPRDKDRIRPHFESPIECATATCSSLSVPLDRGRARAHGRRQARRLTRLPLASVCLYSSVSVNVNRGQEEREEKKAPSRHRRRRGRQSKDAGSTVEGDKTPGPGGQSRWPLLTRRSSAQKIDERATVAAAAAAEPTSTVTVAAAAAAAAAATRWTSDHDGLGDKGADDTTVPMTYHLSSADIARTSPTQSSPTHTVTPDQASADESIVSAPFWPNQSIAPSCHFETSYTPPFRPLYRPLPTPPPLPPLNHCRRKVYQPRLGDKEDETQQYSDGAGARREPTLTIKRSPEGFHLPAGDGGISESSLGGHERQSAIVAEPERCCILPRPPTPDPSDSVLTIPRAPLQGTHNGFPGDTTESCHSITFSKPPEDYPTLPLPYHDYWSTESSMARSRTLHLRKRHAEYEVGMTLRPKRNRREKAETDEEEKQVALSPGRSQAVRRSSSRPREQPERSPVKSHKRGLGKAKSKRCAVACEACRNFKRKCSGEIPCNLCVRRGKEHECRYDPGPIVAVQSANISRKQDQGETEPKRPPRFFGSRLPPCLREAKVSVDPCTVSQATGCSSKGDEQQDLQQTVEPTSSTDSAYSGFEFDDGPHLEHHQAPIATLSLHPFAADERYGTYLFPPVLSPSLPITHPRDWPREMPHSAPSCLEMKPPPLYPGPRWPMARGVDYHYGSLAADTSSRLSRSSSVQCMPLTRAGSRGKGQIVWHGGVASNGHQHRPLSRLALQGVDVRSVEHGALNTLVAAIDINSGAPQLAPSSASTITTH